LARSWRLMADRLAECGVTRRELEVLVALGEHLTNAEIAARFLFRSARSRAMSPRSCVSCR
jgi:DNA-binding CsgD family transcriptional regulator